MKIVSDPKLINKTVWKDFVLTHPTGNFFQTPEAFLFFSILSNYRPSVVALFENEKMLGILSYVDISENGVKSLFSTRTIVWGGPLIVFDNENYNNLLLDAFQEKTKKSIYIEFRNLFPTENIKNSLIHHNFKYKAHLNYIIKIINTEEIQKNFSKSKLRQIRSSLKNGAEIIVAESIHDVREFYALLLDTFRQKVRKPLPTFDFFESFFLNPELGKIFLIKFEDKVIGGIVSPVFNKKYIYEWYVAGKDGEIKGVFPSILATWAPIEYALKNNYQYFDFMGAGSPDSDYGVRKFKSKFGGELVEYGRYVKINKPLLYSIGKFGLKVLGVLKKT